MRKPLICGNWKMNTSPMEGLKLIKEIGKETLHSQVEVCIIPPFTHLSSIHEELKDSPIKLGAQNMYFEDQGAFTGEISPSMLKELGITYVILGHSERREIFKEDDQLIHKKMKAALEHGFCPILCLGETLEEREKGLYQEKVKKQIEADLFGLEDKDFSSIVLAYEPLWAIGTGKTASSKDAEEMCAFIRKEIEKSFGKKASQEVRIQYGGSVKPANIKDIMAMENIDGALVGGASLKADSFAKLVNYKKED